MPPPELLVHALRRCSLLEPPHTAIAFACLTALATPKELAEAHTVVNDQILRVSGPRSRSVRVSASAAALLGEGPTARALRLHEPGMIQAFRAAASRAKLDVRASGIDDAVVRVVSDLLAIAPSAATRHEVTNFLGLGGVSEVQEAPWVRDMIDAAAHAAGYGLQ